MVGAGGWRRWLDSRVVANSSVVDGQGLGGRGGGVCCGDDPAQPLFVRATRREPFGASDDDCSASINDGRVGSPGLEAEREFDRSRNARASGLRLLTGSTVWKRVFHRGVW